MRMIDLPSFARLALVCSLALAAAPAGSPGAEAASAATRDAPPPEECRVGRRSAETLTNLAATPMPVPISASPTAAAEPFALPTGEPIDGTTVQAIAATQREAIACANAGDRIRVLSLYSESFVRRILADAAAQGVSPAQLHAGLTPLRALPPAERSRLLAIRQGRLLPDGRIGAFVDVAPTAADDLVEVDFVWFIKVSGRWLIDDFVVVEIVVLDATPGSGTG